MGSRIGTLIREVPDGTLHISDHGPSPACGLTGGTTFVRAGMLDMSNRPAMLGSLGATSVDPDALCAKCFTPEIVAAYRRVWGGR